MRIVFAAAAVAASSLVFATAAHAQFHHAALHDGHGPEISGGIGIGGFVDDSSTAFTNQQHANNHMYYPGVVLEGALDGRITRWFTMGARLHWQYSGARDLPAGTTGGQLNVLSGGPFARFFIGEAAKWEHFDPWLGVGIEPSATLWAQHETASGTMTTRVTAFSVPIHVGFDWRFTDVVSAGVMGSVAPWLPYEICNSVRPNGDLLCSSAGTAENTYLSLSADLRLQLPW